MTILKHNCHLKFYYVFSWRWKHNVEALNYKDHDNFEVVDLYEVCMRMKCCILHYNRR